MFADPGSACKLSKSGSKYVSESSLQGKAGPLADLINILPILMSIYVRWSLRKADKVTRFFTNTCSSWLVLISELHCQPLQGFLMTPCSIHACCACLVRIPDDYSKACSSSMGLNSSDHNLVVLMDNVSCSADPPGDNAAVHANATGHARDCLQILQTFRPHGASDQATTVQYQACRRPEACLKVRNPERHLANQTQASYIDSLTFLCSSTRAGKDWVKNVSLFGVYNLRPNQVQLWRFWKIYSPLAWNASECCTAICKQWATR